jgi:hypothetical protein
MKNNLREFVANIKNINKSMAEIKGIYYITRDEPFPHIYENADFSPETIKNTIIEGEEKANQALKESKWKQKN